jgi:hypothetical protein
LFDSKTKHFFFRVFRHDEQANKNFSLACQPVTLDNFLMKSKSEDELESHSIASRSSADVLKLVKFFVKFPTKYSGECNEESNGKRLIFQSLASLTRF